VQPREGGVAESEAPSKETHEESETLRQIPFTFSGTSGEYFKIWIVNVFLTIFTLGIYSAWAKVRKKQYFYRSTFLLDAPFDYLAEPKKILKGRLILFGGLIVLIAALFVDPVLLLILAIPAILLFPWLVVKALSFKARNSSYRNVRFDFRGTYEEGVNVFILQKLVTVLTIGFGYPYERYRQAKFVFDNGAYGKTDFMLKLLNSGGFYRVYLWYLGGVALLVGIAGAVILGIGEGFLPGGAYQVFGEVIPLLASLTIIAFLRASGTNLVWSNVILDGNPSSVSFLSTLSALRMIWIYLSNAIAIVLSLGLLIPWASVRTVRYRLSNLVVSSSGDLDTFVASEQEKVEAVGEEVADFFDFDLGI
jgi:uncharacterized membrane protein YjgN (DUF898 family)